jgi:hypothetical protein
LSKSAKPFLHKWSAFGSIPKLPRKRDGWQAQFAGNLPVQATDAVAALYLRTAEAGGFPREFPMKLVPLPMFYSTPVWVDDFEAASRARLALPPPAVGRGPAERRSESILKSSRVSTRVSMANRRMLAMRCAMSGIE